MIERVTSRRAAQQSSLQQLLFTREQVRQMLGGVSVATIIRLERDGRLRPIRLSRSPTSMVFFSAENVRTLVEEAAQEVANG